jgi:hypothetical protein
MNYDSKFSFSTGLRKTFSCVTDAAAKKLSCFLLTKFFRARLLSARPGVDVTNLFSNLAYEC